MVLQHGDLVKIAMGLHDLPKERKAATEARIKNFLKLKFPDITRVGTGDRTGYTAEQAIKLLIGFELLRFRMPPSVIAAVVENGWDKIQKAFGEAAAMMRSETRPAADADTRTFISIDSRALHETGKTVSPDDLKSSVLIEKGSRLADVMSGREPGRFRSGLILDPAFMLDGITTQFSELRRLNDPNEFLKEVAGWS